jgi:hypothetical protein
MLDLHISGYAMIISLMFAAVPRITKAVTSRVDLRPIELEMSTVRMCTIHYERVIVQDGALTS